MLKWALIFALISVAAGVLGFSGVAAGAAGIAKILFVLFLVAFVAVVVLAALVSAALDAFHDVPGETFGRLLARRPAALLVIGIFVVLVALSPAGGAWLTVTLAVAAIAALVFARRGGKPAPEPASAQEPAPAAAPAAASSS